MQGYGVPAQVYERLKRSELSALEKARMGQIVPPTERGLEERRAMDVHEVLTMLRRGEDVEGCAIVDDDWDSSADEDVDEQVADDARLVIYEISSSGMFNIDDQPDVADAEKLRYVHDALGQHHSLEQGAQSL